jgi:hypothetical protein
MSYRLINGSWEIIVNHEIQGVLPDQIDWWWGHIDTTTRYKMWHPTDHVSFTWLIPPATNTYIGAIHRVQEFLNGIPEIPATIDIRWDDPAGAPAEYQHVLVATTTGDAIGTFMHEYQEASFGTRMRSHFWLDRATPEVIVQALIEHNKQEMGNFSLFLPQLYQENCSNA